MAGDVVGLSDLVGAFVRTVGTADAVGLVLVAEGGRDGWLDWVGAVFELGAAGVGADD